MGYPIAPRAAVTSHDVFMAFAAWEIAWILRFNFSLPPAEHWYANLTSIPFVLVIQAVVFQQFGLYRGLWRFASLPDLRNIVLSAGIGSLCIALALFIAIRLDHIPRSVPLLYFAFLVLLLGAPRLCFRLWKDHALDFRTPKGGDRVIIIGAGRGGEAVLREILRSGEYDPIALLDDKPELLNRRIHGIPVVGSVEMLADLVPELDPEFIFIAIPSASRHEMQRIVRLCETVRKPFRTLPPLRGIDDERSAVRKLREVSIDDLLGREKVELDWARIKGSLSGKTAMVTGGGGSIGSELCLQLADLEVAELIVLEQCEFNLYAIEQALSSRSPRPRLRMVLGDVRDEVAVDRTLERYRPDVVFHAAAYKHVPLLETQPREAVRNNIFGTQVVAQAAVRHGCGQFVLISTDKAVNPVSMLGATKRVAELMCAALQGSGSTKFITVRFGNVLGSAGSVVPMFKRQIAEGGPVTVTHKDVSRYFMTVPEACQLILQAASMGSGGEIFVLDMGEPVKIVDLAEQMIRLSGKSPGRDIKIEFTGLRPGEKLTEELFHRDENLEVTQHHKIFSVPRRFQGRRHILEFTTQLEAACDRQDDGQLMELMRKVLHQSTAADVRESKVVPLRST